MKFRLKALGLHLSASACALSLILGALYLGWYYWPGWALTDVTHVVVVMVGVDVVVGPLLTFVIARAGKPRRELVRDIAMIVAVQLLRADLRRGVALERQAAVLRLLREGAATRAGIRYRCPGIG